MEYTTFDFVAKCILMGFIAVAFITAIYWMRKKKDELYYKSLENRMKEMYAEQQNRERVARCKCNTRSRIADRAEILEMIREKEVVK